MCFQFADKTWFYIQSELAPELRTELTLHSDGTYEWSQVRRSGVVGDTFDTVRISNSWKYLPAERRIDTEDLGVCYFLPGTEPNCDLDTDFIILELSEDRLLTEEIQRSFDIEIRRDLEWTLQQ